MKKVILLISLIFAVNFSFADQQAKLSNTPGKSVFDKIRHLYNGGSLLDLDTITNKVASGRCFYANYPDTPVATYLTANRTTTDVGPIEPPIKKYSGVAHAIINVEPSYFDDDSIQVTDTMISKWRIPINRPDERTYTMTYETKEVIFLRRSDPYIVMLARTEKGNVRLACYYFKIH